MKTYDVTVISRYTAKGEYFEVEASTFEVAKEKAREKATQKGWNAFNSVLTISVVGSKALIAIW